MPLLPISTYSNTRLVPYRNNDTAETDSIRLAASLGSSTTPLAPGTLLGELTGVTDVQAIHASGALTAGTYIINATVRSVARATTALNWNASLATINAALVVAGIPLVAAGGPLTTPTDITLTATGGGVSLTVTLTPSGITGGTLSVLHPTTGTAGTPGVYAPYAIGNSDGTQVPKCFLEIPAYTDSSGNAFYGGEWGSLHQTVPVYIAGTFRTTDLVGFDQNALTAMSGRVTSGTLASGIIKLP